MVIWKLEGQSGRLMTWRPQGITDHGPVVVSAFDAGDQWLLEVRVPGWSDRGDNWRENAMEWIGLNALRVDEAGVITLSVKKNDKTEMNLARMASLLASTAMASAYLGATMGLERGAMGRAA
jgi:hypothetical protein